MSYQVRLDEEAQSALVKFPATVRAVLVRELERLASDPVKLSRPAAFPHPEDDSFLMSGSGRGTRSIF
jgi:hypothetical protein